MAAPTDKLEWRTLAQLWRRWTDVVAFYARPDHGRIGIYPEDYEALHRQLLEACAALAQKSDEGVKKSVEDWQAFVSPWLSLRTLEAAEPDILQDLFLRARQLDLELNGPSWRAGRRLFRGVLLWGTALFAVALFFALTASWTWEPLVDALSDVFHSVRVSLKNTTDQQQWMGAGIVFLAIAFFVLVRAVRQ